MRLNLNLEGPGPGPGLGHTPVTHFNTAGSISKHFSLKMSIHFLNGVKEEIPNFFIFYLFIFLFGWGELCIYF